MLDVANRRLETRRLQKDQGLDKTNYLVLREGCLIPKMSRRTGNKHE